jgi:hypothetical protein
MPITRALYDPDWEAISDRIRFDRAGGRCESCGVQHGAIGARDANGQWHDKAELRQAQLAAPELAEGYPDMANRELITIYLQTAHHDRDPANNGEFNLMALCQACHLAHDRHDNWQRRRRNIVRRQLEAGQKLLFKEANR